MKSKSEILVKLKELQKKNTAYPFDPFLFMKGYLMALEWVMEEKR